MSKLPPATITTALVINEVGQQIPMKLVGKYYTADDMRLAIATETERCVKLCEQIYYEYGGISEGPIATEYGKAIFQAMAASAKNCAASIKEESLNERGSSKSTNF